MKNNSYEKEYHLAKHNNLYTDEEYYLARAKVARYDYFEHLNSEAKVLEFGCGLGANIFLLPNAIGYDISNFAVKFCKEKGIKVSMDLNEFEPNSFEVILSCHVLEHLEKPFETLKEIHSKLKVGGILILVLPVDKPKKSSFSLDDDQHLYCWSFRTINNLLIKTGFKPIENKILRRTGYKKLLFFNKININVYLFVTKLAAIITGSRNMKIVSIKE